ncbi:MAG: c-type cytochrome, partial [Thermoguttaceae bacterium]
PSDQLDALVEYVVYLSIRGETEQYLVQLIVDEGEYLPLGEDAKQMVLTDATQWVAEQWAEVQRDPGEYVVAVPARPAYSAAELAASIARGKEIYSSKDAQCALCHGPSGAGDGSDERIYDDWNKPKNGLTAEQTATLARLYTLPLQRLRPRDFREGVFRGGSSPEELYRRIYAGIKGTPMPAAGPQPGAKGIMTPQDIWDVLNYVLSFSKQEPAAGDSLND